MIFFFPFRIFGKLLLCYSTNALYWAKKKYISQEFRVIHFINKEIEFGPWYENNNNMLHFLGTCPIKETLVSSHDSIFFMPPLIHDRFQIQYNMVCQYAVIVRCKWRAGRDGEWSCHPLIPFDSFKCICFTVILYKPSNEIFLYNIVKHFVINIA